MKKIFLGRRSRGFQLPPPSEEKPRPLCPHLLVGGAAFILELRKEEGNPASYVLMGGGVGGLGVS